MKTGRIALATLGVGAALTLGAWTLSDAAVPLPADPISIPLIAPSEAAVADLRKSTASDPARAVADAEARLQAINSRLQTLAADQAAALSASAAPSPTTTAASSAPAPTTSAPTTSAFTPGQAPPVHTVTGASGSTGVDDDDAGERDHGAAEQDD